MYSRSTQEDKLDLEKRYSEQKQALVPDALGLNDKLEGDKVWVARANLETLIATPARAHIYHTNANRLTTAFGLQDEDSNR